MLLRCATSAASLVKVQPMNRSDALRLAVFGFILIVMARHQAHSCDNAILGVGDFPHNVGVYAWNDVLQQHVLVASYLDMELLFSPPEPQPGDLVEYVAASGGQAGLNSCEPPTLPPVVVTTSLRSRTFIGRLFISIRTIFGGGGGFITSTAGVPVPNNPANNEFATCNADELSRLHHAHRDVAPFASARFIAGRTLRAREHLRVTYDDGGPEIWQAIVY